MPIQHHGHSQRQPSLYAHRALALFLATSLGLPAICQEAAPGPHDRPTPVVQVTLSLVQVDAVVTDRSGHHVTGLQAADFEILEDGRRQQITNCTYVSARAPALSAGAPTPATTNTTAAPPRLRPEDVRRAMALVVDDLTLSIDGAVAVRSALEKFVGEQMQPGDLAAVVRTGGGLGALQQFTTDKRLLHAAVAQVRFNPVTRIDAFEPAGSLPVLPFGSSGRGSPSGGRTGQTVKLSNQLRQDMLSLGTLEALRFVMRGLRDLPGRKSVIVFSDGFPIRADRSRSRLMDPLRSLIDLANRASVVVYTIDPRGLTTGGLTAADNVNVPGAVAETRTADLVGLLDARRWQRRNEQESLSALADDTGGLFIRNLNDLSRGIGRVLEDQQGYYLIGYAPDAASFRPSADRPVFHRIKVSVKRAGLRVRSRSGFYGVADDASVDSQAKGTSLLEALASPFASAELRLRASSFFFRHPERGSFVRSLLHVDAHDLSFASDADAASDGGLKGEIEILALTFGGNGVVVDQVSRRLEIRLTPQAHETVLRRGIVYTIDVPVKKPGAYQLRVALRDGASGRVGSAYQFVEVPDLEEDHLALSGLLMGGAGTGAAPTLAAQEGPRFEDEDPEASDAVSRFRPGKPVSYGFTIYNARLDPTSGRPKLETQMRLYRDGRELTVGEARAVDPGEQKDMRALFTGGMLLLGPEMPAGDYVLRVTVTDTLAPAQRRTAVQAIDFELAP